MAKIVEVRGFEVSQGEKPTTTGVREFLVKAEARPAEVPTPAGAKLEAGRAKFEAAKAARAEPKPLPSKLAAGKVSKRTGLTKPQEEYLAGKLEEVAPELRTEKERALGEKPEKGGLKKLQVPGDGTFSVGTQEAASTLHKQITGKPIEGVEPLKRPTYERAGPAQFDVTAEADKAMQLYGEPDVAAKELNRQMKLAEETPEDYPTVNTGRLSQVISELEGRAEGVSPYGKATVYYPRGRGVAPPVKFKIEEAKERLGPPRAKPGAGELSANAVFNPRFWERADAAIRPLTLKIESAIERVFGKLPFSIRRWFQEDPRLKRIMHEARAEVGAVQNETNAVLRMVLKEDPTPQELVIADRIARGIPQDLSPTSGPLKDSIAEAAEYAHDLAQQMTSERAALGLSVRSEWMEGPAHWYPNLWKQHVFSPRMIAGRLFGFFRKAGGAVRPSALEMGSLKARTTDRWVVVDATGKPVRISEGREAIYDNAEDARAYVAANSGYRLRYFPEGSRSLTEQTFPSIKARSEWAKEHPEVRMREMLPGKHLRIVEPMTHEQMVAHGLIEDLALNLRYGFGKERSLIAKTRALEKIGQQLAVDEAQPGYVNLGEVGFEVPPRLAERNPWIARLRDGYVPELVGDGLNALYGKRGAWSNYYRALEGSLRKWVTVYSPFRHPRNLIENYIPLAFRDSKAALDIPAMERGFRDFARGMRGEREVPLWDEFQRSGLASTDIIRGEFETVWKTIDSVRAGAMPLSVKERVAIWAESNPVAAELLRSKETVETLYRAEDQIWKYYYFRTLRERGWTPEAAAQRARRTFFDYEDVPPYVRAINRVVPFVPNITFQYARIVLSALRDDPASATMKVALAMYGYAFMRDQAMKAAGISDQDEKNMGRLGI
ncbi:MAG TPA: hypothetical protein VM182_02935, partial [Terriglobia bacterium]|nr:hypothetical protein [Terriglobia bacterium]